MGRPAKSLQLSWYDNPTTPTNFADAIVAYVNDPGEEAYRHYHFQVIADTFWDTHFPDRKADLTWFVFKLVRKYDLDSFKDKAWVKEYFKWLYVQLMAPSQALEELL